MLDYNNHGLKGRIREDVLRPAEYNFKAKVSLPLLEDNRNLVLFHLFFMLIPQSQAWVSDRAICSTSGINLLPNITFQSPDEAVIVWQDSRFSGDTDIYAQRINLSSGQCVWNINGILYVIRVFIRNILN